MSPIRANARILAAAMTGTAVEFYDFYIYATAAALVFGPLFFPASSPAAQTLFALMSFGIAFVARPVGAIAFGHFGDRIGRKSTLVASLLLMGGSTLAVAFLPTYHQIGWPAPLLLCLARFGQGFGLGGEWGGAALLAVENAPKGWEARFGAAPQLGGPIGFLFANGLFLVLGLLLPTKEFVSWGWRIPFLASAVLVAIGLWIRLRIGETRAFREAGAPPPRVPLGELLRYHRPAVIAGSAGVVACFAVFYLATAWALAEGTGPLGYSRQSFLALQLGANFFFAAGIIGAAIACDRSSPRRVLTLGALLTVPFGVAFGPGIVLGSPLVVFATLAAALALMGLLYAPLSSWLVSLFPVGVRYSGISVAFNAGGIVGGALAPLAAQMLSTAGDARLAGLFLSAAGIMTLAGARIALPYRMASPGQREMVPAARRSGVT
jgi:MFS family permease